MKKMLMTLAAAAAIAAGTLTVSAESYWKYNDTTTIDLDETSLKKTTNGHEILNFVAIQTIPDGTCTYTYAYDSTATSVNSTNPVVKARDEMAEAVYQRKVNHKK